MICLASHYIVEEAMALSWLAPQQDTKSFWAIMMGRKRHK
jgi:hypothetical protein